MPRPIGLTCGWITREPRNVCRIAGHARAGQVVVSEDTARRSGADELRLEPLGPVELKGVARPMPLYQALRTR